MRKYTLISILLVLAVGWFACAPIQVGPTPADDTLILLTLPPPTPTPTATPYPLATPTATPLSTPTPTATPYPLATPTATPLPTPSPDPEATRVAEFQEDEAKVEEFLENFISISYEATFDTSGELNDDGYPFAATVNGWMKMGTTDDPASQFFMKIDMTKPIKRSIEVVSRPNTLTMFLHDLDASRWYFIPENSAEVDVGPIENASHFLFFGPMFLSVLPREEAQQTPDGYIRKEYIPFGASSTTDGKEYTPFGTSSTTYDQEYNLETFTLTDPDGKEIIRIRYFDHNKIHDLVRYEPVEELLPKTYWESQ